MIGRRGFLFAAAAAIGSKVVRSEDDPIAALPAEAWKNARMNGLVMIHHPATGRANLGGLDRA